MSSIKFVAQQRTEFAAVLRKRVRVYFADRQLSQKDDGTVATKGVLLLALYLAPFLTLLVWQPSSTWMWLGLAVLQGLGAAGIGMSLMHDSLHGALSANQKVNEWWGSTMYLLGGWVFGWKMQHNYAHHTYTNIIGLDEDIRARPFLRFCENAPWRPSHRFQHVYALALYPLMLLTMFVQDFVSLKEYDRAGLLAKEKTTYTRQLLVLIVSKALFVSIFIGLPVAVGALGFWQAVASFLVAQCLAGFIMSVVFQLAHVVEETTQPLPVANGTIDNEWMIHQLETTANFCPRNPIINWYTGGLNYQVEHHLFPNICHIHYPALSAIVRETAEEFGVAYHQAETFWEIFASHMRYLRFLGQKPQMVPVEG